GYNRENVYPLLGFSKYLAIDSFKNPQTVRSYISDQEDFNKIISEYENAKKSSNDPFYMFNVTIQNHGGYDKDFANFDQKISITDASSTPSANRYLSLIKKTDDAFKNLVSYFEKVKEPTVIVMFGDHQPKLPDSFYNKVMAKDQSSTIEREQKKHQVPFVIWANYDIKEEEIKAISPNYLASKVIQVCGIEKTPYECYLQELYKKYPVVTGSVYMDNKQNLYGIDSLNDLPEDLKEYQMVQYHHMFAKKQRNDSLFYLGK
ncbi:MAG: LTA synthase family protein, partial [Anaerostipes faecalis]|nr:LTA synthase family protein [Anaerostipes faecalis]